MNNSGHSEYFVVDIKYRGKTQYFKVEPVVRTDTTIYDNEITRFGTDLWTRTGY